MSSEKMDIATFEMPKLPAVMTQHNKPRRFIHVIQAVLGMLCLYSLIVTHDTYIANLSVPTIHHSPSAVGKVTMLYDDSPFLERALDTHRDHSHRQGYPLSVRRNSVFGGGWNKYAVLLSAIVQELEKPLNQRVKWMFWFDSNTILMNPNMPLETFLPPPEFSHVHLLLTKDWNGIKNHVFFLRVHPWSIKLLSAAIAYPATHDPVSSDLSALDNAVQENDYFSRSVVYCPLRWFNAYTRTADDEGWRAGSSPHFQIHPGDLLVNFPRTPYQQLNESMLPYLDLAERHEKRWEPNVEGTGYVEEVARFWKSIHGSPAD